MRWTRCARCSTGLLRWHLETRGPLNRNLKVESAVVRIRTADHPINSRGLYRTELRRPARPYRRGTQIDSHTQIPTRNFAKGFEGEPVRTWIVHEAVAPGRL